MQKTDVKNVKIVKKFAAKSDVIIVTIEFNGKVLDMAITSNTTDSILVHGDTTAGFWFADSGDFKITSTHESSGGIREIYAENPYHTKLNKLL